MKRLAFLLVMLVPAVAPAQAVSPFDRGSQAFRAVLNRGGLKPLDLVQEALADPSKSMIVLFGKTSVYDRQFADDGLKRFIRRGGAVLFASDQFGRGEMWTQLEIGINGSIIVAPEQDKSSLYRGEYVDCPLLQQPKRLRFRSKLDLLGSLRVATNRPSFLNRMPMSDEESFGPDLGPPRLNQARVIAESPAGSLVPNAFQQFIAPEGRYLLAIADTLGKGRYAVCADHSLFLNLMMLQTDNDNIAFAMKLTRWLSDDGKRTQVHFVDDGRVRTDFNLNIDYVDPPLPHPDVLGPMVDQLMGSLERDDFFNQGINKLIPSYRILRMALLALTVLTSGLFLMRLISRRYRADRAVARLPERLLDLATLSTPEIMPTPASISAAARELAQGTLERLLNGSLDARHPPLTTGSGAWVARVRTIWETATDQSRRAGRPADLERLARDLVDLQKAVERGDVRLATGANG